MLKVPLDGVRRIRAVMFSVIYFSFSSFPPSGGATELCVCL